MGVDLQDPVKLQSDVSEGLQDLVKLQADVAVFLQDLAKVQSDVAVDLQDPAREAQTLGCLWTQTPWMPTELRGWMTQRSS